ncbi:MAG TPA: PAS domain S-box protein [Candidatus Paceibacterota bacterium]|nr:PAS domain S-box protein [Candidatus Paceibacterota bacterium]
MEKSPLTTGKAQISKVAAPHGGTLLIVLAPILLLVVTVVITFLAYWLPQTVYAPFTAVVCGVLLLIFSAVIWVMIHITLTPYIAYSNNAGEAIQVVAVASDRHVRAIIGSGLGYWDYDIISGDVYFSGHMMALLGYGEQERTDRIDFWYSLIHPDDIEGVRRTMTYHFDKRTPEYSIEYRIRRANGEYMWVADRGRAEYGPDGKATKLSGVTQDMTNMKRVQEVLDSRTHELEVATRKVVEESRNVLKFKMATDGSVQAVAITNPDGKIIYVNPAWCALNGYSEAEAIGQTHHLLKSSDTPPELFARMYEQITQGNPFTTEDIINVKRDGKTYHAALSIVPIKEGKDILFYVGLSEDITQRKAVDQAKTEFVSLASHQLRTPLSAIRWYSEMLLSKYVGELNEKQRQYVKEIYHGNIRMVDLVNALLNTSRIDLGTFAVEPEPVNLVEICESVLLELNPQILERQEKVERNFAGAPATYNGDPKLLRIVFQNLLSNSVKYTQVGGTIGAEINTRGNDLYISIWDNGYGIPKHQQSSMFQKLFRADNVRQKDTEGTGLGMYIIKAIVESAQGKIWFDSEEDKGTKFHVLMPLSGMIKKTGAKGLT